MSLCLKSKHLRMVASGEAVVMAHWDWIIDPLWLLTEWVLCGMSSFQLCIGICSRAPIKPPCLPSESQQWLHYSLSVGLFWVPSPNGIVGTIICLTLDISFKVTTRSSLLSNIPEVKRTFSKRWRKLQMFMKVLLTPEWSLSLYKEEARRWRSREVSLKTACIWMLW